MQTYTGTRVAYSSLGEFVKAFLSLQDLAALSFLWISTTCLSMTNQTTCEVGFGGTDIAAPSEDSPAALKGFLSAHGFELTDAFYDYFHGKLGKAKLGNDPEMWSFDVAPLVSDSLARNRPLKSMGSGDIERLRETVAQWIGTRPKPKADEPSVKPPEDVTPNPLRTDPITTAFAKPKKITKAESEPSDGSLLARFGKAERPVLYLVVEVKGKKYLCVTPYMFGVRHNGMEEAVRWRMTLLFGEEPTIKLIGGGEGLPVKSDVTKQGYGFGIINSTSGHLYTSKVDNKVDGSATALGDYARGSRKIAFSESDSSTHHLVPELAEAAAAVKKAKPDDTFGHRVGNDIAKFMTVGSESPSAESAKRVLVYLEQVRRDLKVLGRTDLDSSLGAATSRLKQIASGEAVGRTERNILGKAMADIDTAVKSLDHADYVEIIELK